MAVCGPGPSASFKDFYLKAKARTWPRCLMRTTFARQRNIFSARERETERQRESARDREEGELAREPCQPFRRPARATGRCTPESFPTPCPLRPAACLGSRICGTAACGFGCLWFSHFTLIALHSRASRTIACFTFQYSTVMAYTIYTLQLLLNGYINRFTF